MATWNHIPREWLLPLYKGEFSILLNKMGICFGRDVKDGRMEAKGRVQIGRKSRGRLPGPFPNIWIAVENSCDG
jgi:hypothetical protein